jgi:hypothetical protein
MARIQEETIVITISKLHKAVPGDGKTTTVESAIVGDDILATLEGVVEELLGNGVVVEVNKA